VQACDDHEVVCESAITLVAAQRASMESRITDKVKALQVAGSSVTRSAALVAQDHF
jgi:hypothetical protein